jgi:hypothetical protein
VAQRRETEAEGATEGGQYLKYATHLVDHLKAPGQALGMALEIVPQADPFALSAGANRPVQVLLNGQPLAGAEIVQDYVNMPDAAPIIADAEGKASVPLRNQDLNVIAVFESEPHPDPIRADEIGHAAVLPGEAAPTEASAWRGR